MYSRDNANLIILFSTSVFEFVYVCSVEQQKASLFFEEMFF